jgi:hypothetical protein
MAATKAVERACWGGFLVETWGDLRVFMALWAGRQECE